MGVRILLLRKKVGPGLDVLAEQIHNQIPEKSHVSFHMSLYLLYGHPHDEAPHELHSQVYFLSLLLGICPATETCNFPVASTVLGR
jgi:hypothetical protein